MRAIDSEAFRLLIGAGAELDAIDNESRTALVRVTENAVNEPSYRDAIRILVRAGASVSIKDRTGKSAHLLAASHPEILSIIQESILEKAEDKLNLSKEDAMLFKVIGDILYEGDVTQRVASYNDVATKIQTLSAQDIEGSSEILQGERLAEIGWVIGDPRVHHFRLTTLGLSKYCECFLFNFEDQLKSIIGTISEGTSNFEIQSKTGFKMIIINLILELIDESGYIVLAPEGELLHVAALKEKGQRSFKEVLEHD